MKVVVYTASANDIKFQIPIQLMGMTAYKDGHEVKVVQGQEYEEGDLAIIWGSWKDRDTPWHNIKRLVVKNAPNFIVLETPILNRGPVKDVMDDQWYRIGLNGFLSHIGEFNNYNSDDTRWKMFQDKLGYKLKEERTTHKHKPIVVVLQLPGDASLCGHDISEWCVRTVRSIRSVTDRKIIIRKPQVERAYLIQEALKLENVELQEGKHDNVKSTIQAAHALVTFSSGMGVEALIEGTPVIAHHQASFVYDITPNKIEDIENIKLPDREQWIKDMAYTTWSIEEIGHGLPWKHLTKDLSTVELRSIMGH